MRSIIIVCACVCARSDLEPDFAVPFTYSVSPIVPVSHSVCLSVPLCLTFDSINISITVRALWVRVRYVRGCTAGLRDIDLWVCVSVCVSFAVCLAFLSLIWATFGLFFYFIFNYFSFFFCCYFFYFFSCTFFVLSLSKVLNSFPSFRTFALNAQRALSFTQCTQQRHSL